ncbi:MAG: glycerophosphodiester phosphodiesterase [Ktedonobacteraceae bacterium]
MANQVQRIAHRGGSLLAPENTLAAFRNALTMPVDAIELDVQMSRDGQAVVFHDATVERLTNGEGNILDLDFAYLRSLNAAAHFPGGWPQAEQIPTLREVLTLVKGRVQVYIEIKLAERDNAYWRYPKIIETVVSEVRTLKMLDKVLIISFDWQTLLNVKKLEPALTTGAIVSRDLWSPEDDNAVENLCKKVTALGCNWINMDRKLFASDMLPVIRANRFKLGLWTVNSLDELRLLASSSIDSLTSDRPDFFEDIRDQ